MKAIDKDENYAKWTKNEHNYLPWTNVSIEVISLCRNGFTVSKIEPFCEHVARLVTLHYRRDSKVNLNTKKPFNKRRILAPNPSERISMADLLVSKWVTNEVNDETFSVQSTKRLKLANSSALSQPAAHVQTKLNTNLKPSSPDPHRDIEFILPCKVSPSLPVINDE